MVPVFRFKKAVLKKGVVISFLLTVMFTFFFLIPQIFATPVQQGFTLQPDGSVYWETSCVGRINVSQNDIRSGNEVYINATRLNCNPAASAINVDVAFGIDADQTLVSKAELLTIKKINVSYPNITLFNVISHPNATQENNYSKTLINITRTLDEWKDVSSAFSSFSYDGKTWYYATASFSPNNETKTLRAVLRAKKYGGSIKWGMFIKPAAQSLATVLSNGNYVYLDPVINATSFGMTMANSDISDINISATTAELVDGVLVMGANNSGNWSAHDGFYTANNILLSRADGHSWTNASRENTAGGQDVAFNVTGTSLNMSIFGLTSGGTIHSYVFTQNLSVPASGILASMAFRDHARQAGSNDFFRLGFNAFRDGWGANIYFWQDGNQQGMQCSRSGNGDISDSTYEILNGAEQTAANANSTTAYNEGGFIRWRLFINSSHAMCMVNESAWTPLFTHSCAECTSGAVGILLQVDGDDPVSHRNMVITNFTVANVSGTFGNMNYKQVLPLGYDNSTFQVTVFNSTASISTVDLNITFYENLSMTSTQCQVANANHGSVQSLNIGTGADDITDITGVMFNCTLGSNDVVASPVINTVNFSYTLAVNDPPNFNANYSNITTIRFGNVVGYNVNFTDDGGGSGSLGTGTLQENMSSYGVLTNTSVKLGGLAQNVTFNITNNLRYSGSANLNISEFIIIVNDSAAQETRSAKILFTIANTVPNIPNIIFPSANGITNLNRVNVTNVSDADGSIITLYWYVNGTFNGTSDGNFTFIATPEKTLAVNVSAYDGTDWSSNSTTAQFMYDNLTPRLNYGENSDANNSYVNRNWVYINVSWAEINNNTLIFRNGSSNFTNIAINATYAWFNFTSRNDENFTIFLWLNDTASNVNQTLNRTVVVDTTSPTQAYGVNSQSNNSFIKVRNFRVNLTSVELYGDNITTQLANGSNIISVINGTLNISGFGNHREFLNLADDKYNFSATLRDVALNTNAPTTLYVTVDLEVPIITNVSISPTSAVAGNPFTATATVDERYNETVTFTIAGANYTASCTSVGSNTSRTCSYTFTETSLVGGYVVSKWYANDSAANTGINSTGITFTAESVPQASGASAGGASAGAGAPSVITIDGVSVVINGSFTATPGEFQTWTPYFPDGDEIGTWSKMVQTNAPIKLCVTTGEFTCSIDSQTKTKVRLELKYKHDGLSETYKGEVTLLSENNNAVTIPIVVTTVKLGVSLPFKFTMPKALEPLAIKAFFQHTPEGQVQPRVLLPATVVFLPTLWKALRGRNILKRKPQRVLVQQKA